MMYHVSNKFLKRNQNLLLKLGYFHFSASSSTFLTTCWLLIFLWNECSLTILSIDRSVPRFESHTGVQIRYLEKTTEILGVFANFPLIQVQNCCGQIEKMKAGTLIFPLKKACQSLTDGARLKSVLPPVDFTRILKSYHKRIDRRKFPEKQEWPIPREVIGAA